MGTISYIDGDIFEVDKSYAIGHQCNCTSNTISGLAAEVYKRYPKANIRNNTNKPELLGNIDSYQTNDGKLIINLYAQLNKGKANIAYDDCESARLQALWQALTKTKMLTKKLALPYLIGCGMAGGNWQVYKAELELFAKLNNIELLIVRKVE